MICSMCNKNQASIFSSKITPDGKREMEGLCINCAKKLGINTDEIIKAQNQSIINNRSEQMNKQFEGLLFEQADDEKVEGYIKIKGKIYQFYSIKELKTILINNISQNQLIL